MTKVRTSHAQHNRQRASASSTFFSTSSTTSFDCYEVCLREKCELYAIKEGQFPQTCLGGKGMKSARGGYSHAMGEWDVPAERQRKDKC